MFLLQFCLQLDYCETRVRPYCYPLQTSKISAKFYSNLIKNAQNLFFHLKNRCGKKWDFEESIDHDESQQCQRQHKSHMQLFTGSIKPETHSETSQVFAKKFTSRQWTTKSMQTANYNKTTRISKSKQKQMKTENVREKDEIPEIESKDLETTFPQNCPTCPNTNKIQQELTQLDCVSERSTDFGEVPWEIPPLLWARHDIVQPFQFWQTFLPFFIFLKQSVFEYTSYVKCRSILLTLFKVTPPPIAPPRSKYRSLRAPLTILKTTVP